MLDINDDHLAVFNNDLKVTDRGHFLRGVYAVKDQMVYASVYEGPKKDSLLHALSDLEMSKTKLGDQYTWWANANTLFLNSSTQIVMVSFPQNLSTDIIPTNGQSILFELCD